MFDKEPEKAEKFISDTINRISTTTNVEKAAAQTDLVIEAIIENLKTKHELFALLENVCICFVVSRSFGDIVEPKVELFLKKNRMEA